VLCALVAAALLAAPVGADATEPVTAVVAGVVGGASVVARAPADVISFDVATSSYIFLRVGGFTLAARLPAGGPFVAGVTYDSTMFDAATGIEVVDMTVGTASDSCSDSRITVRDVAYATDGSIVSLAASIDARCRGTDSFHAEIRMASLVPITLLRFDLPDAIFESVAGGLPAAEHTLTVTNVGDADAEVHDLRLGTPGEGFVLEHQTCVAVVLKPGESCSAVVLFRSLTTRGGSSGLWAVDPNGNFLAASGLVGSGVPALATNDTIASATNVDALPYSAVEDVSRATSTPADPRCGVERVSTVWFRFRPTIATTYSANVGRSSRLGPYLHAGVCVYRQRSGGLELVATDRMTGRDASFVGVAGSVYLIEVSAGPGIWLTLDIGHDTFVDAVWRGADRDTFYPYPDGYLDTDTIRGSRYERLAVTFTIYRKGSSHAVARHVLPFGSRDYAWAWNGRGSNGRLVAAGEYRVAVELRDESGNARTVSVTVVVRRERVRWHVAHRLVRGGAFLRKFTYVQPGGYLRPAASSYPGGVLCSSTGGVTDVGYRYPYKAKATWYADFVARVVGTASTAGTASVSLTIDIQDVSSAEVRAGSGTTTVRVPGVFRLTYDERITGFFVSVGVVARPHRRATIDVATVDLRYRWAELS
jgi:hypothetical protein